ncbi:MAG: DUF4105 domain-containing protein [Candidatus Riflebacteria bacterium]|nr:DUF4105 domain-containing protein [Candidatus Riflebacteria bacterium]
MKRVFILLALVLLLTPVWAGVFYRVDGVVTVHPEAVTLSTEDGRLFRLDLAGDAARTWDGKLVRVEGYVAQADELENLAVKSIKALPAPTGQAAPAPAFHIRQRQPHLKAERDGKFTIGNARWGFTVKDNQVTAYNWVDATIDPAKVDQVYFVKKPFKPEWLAAHACMLFTFKPGGFVNAAGQESRGLLLSIEAHLTTDQKYDLFAGLKATFGSIWLLVAWEDYAAEACDPVTRGLGKMFLYPFTLSAAQKQELLRVAVRQAVIVRRGEFYHTTRNNCTNNLLVLVNHVIPKKIKLWTIPSLIYNVRATMPRLVPSYLQKKGLLGKELPEINETNYFVDIDQLARGPAGSR